MVYIDNMCEARTEIETALCRGLLKKAQRGTVLPVVLTKWMIFFLSEAVLRGVLRRHGAVVLV